MKSARSLVTLTCSLATSLALLASCSSDAGSKTATNTTPATATTSTAAPQSTVAAATVAPPAVTVATIAPVVPQTTGAVSVPASTQTTTGSTRSPGSTEATDGRSTTEFTPAAPPKVPSTSAAVLADNSHPDGVYYATVTEGGDPPPAAGSVVFELVQLFVGPDCTAHFGVADQDSCVNDYGVDTDPTSTLEVRLTDQYITVSDAATQHSFRISGAELYGLLHGDDPSVGAPPAYIYSGFGFFITISGGKVTRLEQWWTP